MRFDPKSRSLDHCPFEKHKHRPWEDVIEEDRPYVEWLVSGDGPALSDELYSHLMDLLEET